MNDFPYVGPPADGLVQAMTAARSRRLRKASASSGASALALTLVAVLASTPGRTTLSQDPTPEQPAVPVNVLPDDKSKTTATAPQGLKVALSAPGTTTAGAGSFAPLTSGSPLLSGPSTRLSTANPQRSSRSVVASPYKAGPISREDSPTLTVPTCAVQGDGQSYTVCPQGYVTEKSNRTFLFELELYNGDTNPLTLTFPDADEVDFVVYSTKPGDAYTPDKSVWRWSDTHPGRAGAHQHVVDGTSSTTWSFTYTLVDSSGRALPKGDYLMRPLLLANAPARRTVPDTRFTVS